MGIGINVAAICAQEHVRRPLGDVLLFGRQTMFFSPRMAVDLLTQFGIKASGSIGIDSTTTAATGDNIRDDEFFRLLGVKSVQALDRSPYEGAEVIHDLNTPIGPDLENSVDFILDGSTLDNVWNLPVALVNMARMLRPGGRIVSVNMASNHNGPYLVMSPTWILDYFVLNRFADCQVSVTLIRGDGAFNTFSLDLERLNRNNIARNFESRYTMGLQFVAEKGSDSTWNRIPTQQQYRNNDEWDEYERNLKSIPRRQGLWGSGVPQMMKTPPGYRFETAPEDTTSLKLRRASSRLVWLARALTRRLLAV